MQDIYAFDVGDFGKLGLLRRICELGKLRLGVLWWKTDLGSNGGDGRHVGYLKDPTFRVCDPGLWEEMGQRFNPKARSIIDLHPMLPNDTIFHDAPVPSGGHRKHWMSDAMGSVRGSDLVFCDPDNGVIFDGRCDSRRHISSNEVRDLYRAGHSIIVYHTPNRSAPHATQLESGLDHFRRHIEGLSAAWAAHFRRGSSRVFFVLAQEDHADRIGKAISQMESSAWTKYGHFEFHSIGTTGRMNVGPEKSVSKMAEDQRISAQPATTATSQASNLQTSSLRQIEAVCAEKTGADTARTGEGLVRVVLNDNGGLNTASNPWLEDVDVPCRLSAGNRLTFGIEAAFSGRRDMYRISPSALSLARRFAFAGDHLSKSASIVFEARILAVPSVGEQIVGSGARTFDREPDRGAQVPPRNDPPSRRHFVPEPEARATLAETLVTILKNMRVEQRTARSGRIRTKVVITWDIVEDGRLIAQHVTPEDAERDLRRRLGKPATLAAIAAARLCTTYAPSGGDGSPCVHCTSVPLFHTVPRRPTVLTNVASVVIERRLCRARQCECVAMLGSDYCEWHSKRGN